MTQRAFPKITRLIAKLEDAITDTSAQLEEARTRRERSPLNKRLFHDRKQLLELVDLRERLERRRDA